MKITYNWLKQFLPITTTPDDVAVLLTDCGLEVEHLEHWQSIRGGLKEVVVGHILTCTKHPNADRLNITTVDTGDGIIRQIVCGAPNVAAGQKAIVALPGAVLYPTSGEPFEIKKSKIRGEDSNGMICAEDEIGLGTSHAGIMILPDETKIGMPAADYFSIESDFIFEIGLTPNRADAASHLGVARDIKAVLSKKEEIKLVMPDVSKFKEGTGQNKITVDVRDTEACVRYSGVLLEGIQVKDSPQWLKNKLIGIGLRPINNIVDVTNYVMHELGQPLHAFDADKIAGNKIFVTTLPLGTKFKTLDGVERTLNGKEWMIADVNGGMCIAGVFGGADSGVVETTTSLFLESACFNSVNVRKAARHHNLNTDSSFRFERGTDPEMTVFALQRAATLIQEIAGGTIVSTIIDCYPKKVAPKKVELSFDYLNTLIGNEIPRGDVIRILTALDIRIVEEQSELLVLEVPAFKVDVTRPADVVEEILRIYGYNAIALPQKMGISLSAGIRPDPEKVLSAMSRLLVDNGFNEILNNSLTKNSYAEVYPLSAGTTAVQVLNPLSNDLAILRHQMLLTGLESVAYNINRKQKDLRFFETGKTYLKTGDVYHEHRYLSIWLTGNKHAEHWNVKTEAYDIYFLKAIVFNLLEAVGVMPSKQLSLTESAEAPFAAALIGSGKKNKQIAKMGLVQKELLKATDISQEVWYAEIDLDELMKLIPSRDEKAPEPPKFPEVRRDLSMLLDRAVNYSEVEKLAYSSEPKLLKHVNLFDVYEGDKMAAGKKSYALSFILGDNDATLQDKQIDAVMEKLMKQFETKLGATIRRQ